MSDINSVSVYDGRDRIGIVIRRAGGVDAFDQVGAHLGTFPNIKAAAAAICNPRSSSCVRDPSERGGGG
jgi:hypothetical protein